MEFCFLLCLPEERGKARGKARAEALRAGSPEGGRKDRGFPAEISGVTVHDLTDRHKINVFQTMN